MDTGLAQQWSMSMVESWRARYPGGKVLRDGPVVQASWYVFGMDWSFGTMLGQLNPDVSSTIIHNRSFCPIIETIHLDIVAIGAGGQSKNEYPLKFYI